MRLNPEVFSGASEPPSAQSPLSGPVLGGLGLGEVLGGHFELCFTVDHGAIDSAQALRYRVFYEEMRGRASAETQVHRRDVDEFDAVCDHLIVRDLRRGNASNAVVGTYRLIRREAAERLGRFYSEDEFDIDALRKFPGPILELGRSCVDPDYRSGPVLQLLWRGIAAYISSYDIKLMFGCASFQGTSADELALPLSYLHHAHLAPPELMPRARPWRRVEMVRLPADAIDARAAWSLMPPLVKGYLRVGGAVGDGAVFDHQFNTTDVCVVLRADQLADRYHRRYELGARAVAARGEARLD